MITPEQRMERTILALCDELFWGLRFFYAAKVLYETELRLTPTLFDTFYWSCLDQSALILSRMVVAKPNDDESINIPYLLGQARTFSELFHFSIPGEIEKLVETHFKLLESYRSVIDILKDQRDRNLAHLDRKHVNQPEWCENQTKLDLGRVEQLYKDLIGVMTEYHKLFIGKEFNFGQWEIISQKEVEILIAFYEAYQRGLQDPWGLFGGINVHP